MICRDLVGIFPTEQGCCNRLSLCLSELGGFWHSNKEGKEVGSENEGEGADSPQAGGREREKTSPVKPLSARVVVNGTKAPGEVDQTVGFFFLGAGALISKVVAVRLMEDQALGEWWRAAFLQRRMSLGGKGLRMVEWGVT